MNAIFAMLSFFVFSKPALAANLNPGDLVILNQVVNTRYPDTNVFCEVIEPGGYLTKMTCHLPTKTSACELIEVHERVDLEQGSVIGNPYDRLVFEIPGMIKTGDLLVHQTAFDNQYFTFFPVAFGTVAVDGKYLFFASDAKGCWTPGRDQLIPLSESPVGGPIKGQEVTYSSIYKRSFYDDQEITFATSKISGFVPVREYQWLISEPNPPTWNQSAIIDYMFVLEDGHVIDAEHLFWKDVAEFPVDESQKFKVGDKYIVDLTVDTMERIRLSICLKEKCFGSPQGSPLGLIWKFAKSGWGWSAAKISFLEPESDIFNIHAGDAIKNNQVSHASGPDDEVIIGVANRFEGSSKDLAVSEPYSVVATNRDNVYVTFLCDKIKRKEGQYKGEPYSLCPVGQYGKAGKFYAWKLEK